MPHPLIFVPQSGMRDGCQGLVDKAQVHSFILQKMQGWQDRDLVEGSAMKRSSLKLVCVFAIVFPFCSCQQSARQTSDYAVSPVSYRDVQISDPFWTPRLEINRTVSIPGLFDRYERKKQNPDLRLIEAACYVLAHNPDPALRGRVDTTLHRAIDRIRGRKQIWSSEGDGDFFWAGHFLELAAAYYETTGSRKLLDVAIEIGDDLDSVFGPGKRHDISNHEGIKIGLIRLYRCTRNDKYLKLAQFFLDTRGNPANRQRMYGPYAQDHEPVKSQSRATGHAVRATYLYIPLTDIAALTGDAEYDRADQRIWEDAVSRRTFLTGGIGSYRDEEDYGDDFDLPNLACWNEICAAYGNAIWNQRLFQLHQDAKYVDVLERILYNGFLAGVSLDGGKYLYQAPLRAYRGFSRQPWFGPNCCPPNLVRLLPQLGGSIYASADRSLYVNLFVGSRARVKLGDTPITLSQETRYPWEGNIRITVDPEKPSRFALLMRIPGWARNEPMPGGLYRYLPAPGPKFALSVNGAEFTPTLDKGYARIEREWKQGDIVQLSFPMAVRRVVAAEKVADDRGMVALERGPLVFCAEQADNPGGVFNLLLADDAALAYSYREDHLGGLGEIRGKALALSRGADRVSVVKTPRDFTAIPYFAFGNRGPGEMSVWLAREESKVWIQPAPTIASTSKATSSCGGGTVEESYPGNEPPAIERRFYPSSQDGSGDIRAISDQIEPVNSEDGSAPFLRLHPQSGDRAWVQYDFARPFRVSSVEVYWKDDKQVCVLPASWRLLYKEGNEWKPVDASDPYAVDRDRFNRVSFKPVTASGLRLEIRLQGKVYKKGGLGPPDGNYLTEDLTWYECGIIEWRVNR